MISPTLLRTPLFDKHREAGARFVEFAGFEMPVQYTGVIEEHRQVRERAGVFDVSHMGEFVVRGPGAVEAVNQIVTNDLRRIGPGRAQYTLLVDHHGGIIDDLIAYIVRDDEVFLVVNAATRAGDWEWVSAQLSERAPDLLVEDQTASWAQLAVQGPLATGIVAAALHAPHLHDLKPFRFVDIPAASTTVRVATTGYTGSGGVEIYAPREAAEALWDALFAAAEPSDLAPIGLGARDTLRLEMGYCLYGADVDRQTNPFEANLDWVVRLDKPAFVGQAALVALEQRGPTRKLVGFGLNGRAIARHGAPVFLAAAGTAAEPDATGGDPSRDIVAGGIVAGGIVAGGIVAGGIVTSGTRSPSLERPIGLAMLPTEWAVPGTAIEVEIRGKRVEGVVETLPFWQSK